LGARAPLRHARGFGFCVSNPKDQTRIAFAVRLELLSSVGCVTDPGVSAHATLSLCQTQLTQEFRETILEERVYGSTGESSIIRYGQFRARALARNGSPLAGTNDVDSAL
jgi:hypothetical protein